MHQLGRIRRLAGLLIVGIAVSCGVERQPSPTAPLPGAVGVSNSDVESQLVRDIANLKAALSSSDFYGDLDPSDAAGIQRRRGAVQAVLTRLENQLHNPQRPRLDEAPAAPDCYDNDNLNNCFLYYSHSMPTSGPLHVAQGTGMIASHQAVVAYSLDGTMKPSISVGGEGFSISGTTFVRDVPYDVPDCNVSAHAISSIATHLISMSFIAAGGIDMSASGHQTSSKTSSCAFKGLTVTASNGGAVTMNQQIAMMVDVTNFTECGSPSAVTANPNVATLVDYGDGHFRVVPVGQGVTTVTATCGTQYGVTSIRIWASVDISLSSTASAGQVLRATASCGTLAMRTTGGQSGAAASASMLDPGSSLTWSSSNPAVATIDSGGVVTAIAPGTTNIRAACSNAGTGSVKLDVYNEDGTGGSGGGGSVGGCDGVWYGHWTKVDGVWYQGPDVCMPAGLPPVIANIRQGMVAIDPTRTAIANYGPPQLPNNQPWCTADRPNLCWVLFHGLETRMDIEENEHMVAAPYVYFVGGSTTNNSNSWAYPVNVVFRYNGAIVGTTTVPYATSNAGIAYPPAVYMPDVQPGDIVVASAEITDAKGVKLTTAMQIIMTYPEEGFRAQSARNKQIRDFFRKSGRLPTEVERRKAGIMTLEQARAADAKKP